MNHIPSAEELVAAHPDRHTHGTRVRYMAGCKCVPCRAANSRYETERARQRKLGLANPIVSARRAREKLMQLRAAGIGHRRAASLSGVAATVCFKIVSGERVRIRKSTERGILAIQATVGAMAPGGYIDAGPTWDLLQDLLGLGWSRTAIAAALGRQAANGRPSLQIGSTRVRKSTAGAVALLYRRVAEGGSVSFSRPKDAARWAVEVGIVPPGQAVGHDTAGPGVP